MRSWPSRVTGHPKANWGSSPRSAPIPLLRSSFFIAPHGVPGGHVWIHLCPSLQEQEPSDVHSILLLVGPFCPLGTLTFPASACAGFWASVPASTCPGCPAS